MFIVEDEPKQHMKGADGHMFVFEIPEVKTYDSADYFGCLKEAFVPGKTVMIKGQPFKLVTVQHMISPEGMYTYKILAETFGHANSESLNAWVDRIHKLNVEKGWYEGEARKPAEFHMLFVSEVAEATEAVRNGELPVHFVSKSPSQPLPKPEGEAIELADCVIRIMDYFGHRGWDLEQAISLKYEYNKTRPHRHGGKSL